MVDCKIRKDGTKVFSIDVGAMPKEKIQAYIELMKKEVFENNSNYKK